jgi:hypothetical protein
MIFTVMIGIVVQPYPITPVLGSAGRGIAAHFGSKGVMISSAVAVAGESLIGIQ